MSTTEAARTLAARRREIDRAPILAKCAEMRVAMGLRPHPGLIPELILTQADRLC